MDRNVRNIWRLCLLPVAILSAAPAAADGQNLFKRQCSGCHATSADGPQRQGPTLNGIFGRKAGAIEGFNYSKGLSEADFVWDEANLDAWLTNPQEMVKGTFMAYRQSKPDIRRDIIEYLKEPN